ncbi:protein of unknown function [Candidatus Nitrospira inopinata]|uniref:Uncharacterized protein n=1 Tax=Candidatus Nitrospira inopinata TaxID=1715989 RepID=A0A0S4KY90_9BACT|nr:protein of unknown function [Candidatus Nitrospira inopinata]
MLRLRGSWFVCEGGASKRLRTLPEGVPMTMAEIFVGDRVKGGFNCFMERTQKRFIRGRLSKRKS